MEQQSKEALEETALKIAFLSGIASGVLGSSTVIHTINHTSVYNPLHNHVEQLKQDNQEIATDLRDPHLKGFTGQTIIQGHLKALQSKNNQQITTLAAKEPMQVIGQGAELGIEMGSGFLAGAVVFAAMLARARRHWAPVVADLS